MLQQVDQIRVYVLTDRQAKAKNFRPREIAGKTVKLELPVDRCPCVYIPRDAANTTAL